MSDFDQLIKEKINSKEYPYSAKNWHSFNQKAGWRGGFSTAHWIWSSVAVVAVAVGVFFAIRVTKDAPPAPAPVQSIEKKSVMEEVSVPEDETTERLETTANEAQVPATPVETVKNDVANSNKLPKADPQPETPATDTTTKPGTPIQKPTQSSRITRIFVIDPDTIPSNDF